MRTVQLADDPLLVVERGAACERSWHDPLLVMERGAAFERFRMPKKADGSRSTEIHSNSQNRITTHPRPAALQSYMDLRTLGDER